MVKIVNIQSYVWIPHHQVLSTLLWRIEEESTEEWDPHAVTQDCQIGLCELKGSRVLVHHLPHAVQEEHEQWGLDRKKTKRTMISICALANPLGLVLSNLLSNIYLLFVILL